MNDIAKNKPKAQNSLAAQELDKAQEQFQQFDENVKKMTMDRMNQAPRQETEPQTKLSQNEIAKKPDIYLKPKRTIATPNKFNEDYREAYNFDKEYVHFIAENKEIIGEDITIWTLPYAGMPAEEWVVPTNKPLWGPRYLAEQIRRKTYHRLVMKEQVIDSMGVGQFYGQMAVDTTVDRLTCVPVSTRKSVFMGALSA
jgi:hypothetical protein